MEWVDNFYIDFCKAKALMKNPWTRRKNLIQAYKDKLISREDFCQTWGDQTEMNREYDDVIYRWERQESELIRYVSNEAKEEGAKYDI